MHLRLERELKGWRRRGEGRMKGETGIRWVSIRASYAKRSREGKRAGRKYAFALYISSRKW